MFILHMFASILSKTATLGLHVFFLLLFLSTLYSSYMSIGIFFSVFPDFCFVSFFEAHVIVCANKHTDHKTYMFLSIFILQPPDEQIHHFRKEIDICKKL